MKMFDIPGKMVFISILACCAMKASSEEIPCETLHHQGVLLHVLEEQNVLCVINTDAESGAHWFLLQGGGHNTPLGTNLSELHSVYQLVPSPDQQYLAVLSAGEGHPIIEIVELQRLLGDQEYVSLYTIDPYPGTVWISVWEEQRLLLKSTVPLTLRGEDGRVAPSLLMDEEKGFAFNMESGDMESLDFELAELVQQNLSKLTHERPSTRIEAAYALNALGYVAALPVLETLLLQETHPDVLRAFQKAIDDFKKIEEE